MYEITFYTGEFETERFSDFDEMKKRLETLIELENEVGSDVDYVCSVNMITVVTMNIADVLRS
jgi:hypothetical protein